MFFKRDSIGAESLSSLRIRVPTITSDDFVGNLGAPLRSSFTPGPRASESSSTGLLHFRTSTGLASGSSPHQRQGALDKGKARATVDPLLDWDVDELDDEDLEDMEITSRRPILVGLEVDMSMRGGGSVESLWRKDFDGIGVRREEAVSLISPTGNKSTAQTPIRSTHSHSTGEGDRNSLPLNRQPSKSTVDEGDALLVDADDDDGDPGGYPRDLMRSSMASTVNSELGRQVSPRRVSYFT